MPLLARHSAHQQVLDGLKLVAEVEVLHVTRLGVVRRNQGGAVFVGIGDIEVRRLGHAGIAVVDLKHRFILAFESDGTLLRGWNPATKLFGIMLQPIASGVNVIPYPPRITTRSLTRNANPKLGAKSFQSPGLGLRFPVLPGPLPM